MSDGWSIDVAELAIIMGNTADFGFIDPLDGLRYSRVWMLSAQNDTVVDVSVVKANEALYSLYLEHPSQMTAIYTIPGEHSQLTASTGSPCTFLGSPYINNCDYDAAGNMLQFLYNYSLSPPASNGSSLFTCKAQETSANTLESDLPACEGTTPAGAVLHGASGNLYSFDQGLFVGGGGWDSMWGLAETAYVYIPNACLQSGGDSTLCILHTAFHGCLQTTDQIGTLFITSGGYLPWADANNIVVLFPQAVSNALNPKGCFDWWGYTGTGYASQISVQPLAVRGMMDVLMGAPITPNRTMAEGEQYESIIAAAKANRKH
jgi:hypothetical protein